MRTRYFVAAGLLAFPWYFLLTRNSDNRRALLGASPIPVVLFGSLALTLLSAAAILYPVFLERHRASYWLLPPLLFSSLIVFFVIWFVLLSSIRSAVAPVHPLPPGLPPWPLRLVGSAGFMFLVVAGFLQSQWPLALVLLFLTHFVLLAASHRATSTRA